MLQASEDIEARALGGSNDMASYPLFPFQPGQFLFVFQRTPPPSKRDGFIY